MQSQSIDIQGDGRWKPLISVTFPASMHVWSSHAACIINSTRGHVYSTT